MTIPSLRRRTALLVALLLAGAAAPSSHAAFTAADRGSVLAVASDSIALEIHKSTGGILSIRRPGGPNLLSRSAAYFDADYFLPASNDPTHFAFKGARQCRVIRQNDQLQDIAITFDATAQFPLAAEIHYVLRPQDSGFYVYLVLRHTANMPSFPLGQLRMVLRPDPLRFTSHALEETGITPMPSPRDLRTSKTIQDATCQLRTGTVYTKYDYSVFEANHHLHGLLGADAGLWMISASNEYLNGGPTKQNLSVHATDSTPVLLRMLQSGHFGAGATPIQGDWQKLYGPFFVYTNALPDPNAALDDAKHRAALEISRWPYTWLDHPAYPLQRGRVTGRLKLPTGSSPAGAWVVLAQPASPFWQQGTGYLFWTQTNSAGMFEIPQVRPGRYSLYAFGGDILNEFQHDDITVESATTTALGDLLWTPLTHGRRLWQIGVADRSAAEFRNGDDYRHYGLWRDYPRQFPNDVNFIIGKSSERTDWNYVHPVYAGQTPKSPVWNIRFDLDQPLPGKAHLTLAFAGARDAHLNVALNGSKIASIPLPTLGNAANRSGVQDGYHLHTLSFDAALLKPGPNVISLSLAHRFRDSDKLFLHASCPAFVMYDCIRLEVSP